MYGLPSEAKMDEFESGYLVIAMYILKDFYEAYLSIYDQGVVYKGGIL